MHTYNSTQRSIRIHGLFGAPLFVRMGPEPRSSEAKSKMAGKVGLGALHTMDYENSVPRRNTMHGEAMVMRLQIFIFVCYIHMHIYCKCICIYIYKYLVGGLEHEFYFSIYWE